MGKGSASQVRKTKDKNPCTGVCDGKAAWWVNSLCAPAVLPARACLIYTLPCIEVYLNRCLSFSLRKLCIPCLGCPCFTYTDNSFPAKPSSIGNLKTPKPDAKWLKGAEAVGLLAAASGAGENGTAMPTHAVLIREGITPSDIAQGALGDCWLLSAFACLAEFPGAIENLFLTREVSPRGKYAVRLYDDRLGNWRVVTVDDSFPCDASGTPLFAQPHQGELWVLVLEKA